MNETLVHPAAGPAVLDRRLRSIGVMLVRCASSGGLAMPPPPRGADWLADLCFQAPMMRRAIEGAVQQWNGQDDPQAREALPGVWLVPLPEQVRRRRSGYAVAIVMTADLPGAEHLVHLCRGAELDLELVRRSLESLPPVAASEVPRLAALLRHAHDDRRRLDGDVAAAESVGRQLAESYEEINLLYTIIQSMSVVQQPRRFVSIACEELLETLPYRWIGARFREDHPWLKSLAGRLTVAGDPGRPTAVLREITGVLLDRVRPGQPLIVEPHLHPEVATLGRAVLVHPVSRDRQVIGLLIAADKQGEDDTASSVDMKLLGATATHMAIFLENAALYDDLNTMFLGTLEALTASIDAKDRYTCGHSLRVAELTQQLARAAGVEPHEAGRMRIAGLVHDVGKIGVPEEVLTKAGRLTEEEFALIQKHPEIGYRILRDIPQLQDILPGVLHHHERWDGRGYPAGLAGEQIPLIARIIALADSFDAMSSTRTYRPAMSRPAVLEEIRVQAGRQFDPELAPLFIELDFDAFDALVAEHSAGHSFELPESGRAA